MKLLTLADLHLDFYLEDGTLARAMTIIETAKLNGLDLQEERTPSLRCGAQQLLRNALSFMT